MNVSPPDPSPSAGIKEFARATADLVPALQQASERQARFLRRLIPSFLLECPQLLHTMRQAIDARDAGKLNFAAHTLKGVVSFLAVGPITEAARQLETMDSSGIRDEAGAAFAFLDRALAELLPILADFAQQPDEGSPPPSLAP